MALPTTLNSETAREEMKRPFWWGKRLKPQINVHMWSHMYTSEPVSILSLQEQSVNWTKQATAGSSPMSLDCSVQSKTEVHWNPTCQASHSKEWMCSCFMLFCWYGVETWCLLVLGDFAWPSLSMGELRQETLANYDRAHADRTFTGFSSTHSLNKEKHIINMQ